MRYVSRCDTMRLFFDPAVVFSLLAVTTLLLISVFFPAWAWLHKLRRAMVRPERELLSGVVELDGIFLGGRSAGKPGGASDKVAVMVAVERLETGQSA